MHFWLILKLVVLLAVANSTPVILSRFLGNRWSYPLDFGVIFVDGRPLLGSSKTIRGILFSVLATAVAACVVGLGLKTGFVIGSVAMAGDLFSSFLKRRMGLIASSKATGLDQVPESLFPLLACRPTLSLTTLDIAAAVAVFFLGEVFLSIVFFKLHVRDRPY
jgi:CDP-diglyceride synthetase